MNYSSVLGLLLCTLSLTACDFDSNDPIVVPEIEKEFYVDIWEELQNGERHCWVLIETIKPEDCLNASIVYDLDQLGNSLTISLDDILVPSNCEPGEAPAAADLNLGELTTRSFDLNINLKNAIFNNGALQVNYDSYQFVMENPEGILFKHKELKRVPNTAIWGYISYQDNSQYFAAQTIASEIEDISYEADYPEGYYGYYTIAPNTRTLSLHEQPNTDKLRVFLYDYTGNDTILEDKLASLRAAYPAPAFEIKVWNAKGESL